MILTTAKDGEKLLNPWTA